ncbi:hypothetical protein PTKIN_Ptkin16aG0005700 [Pterospermum kingtungense]
MDLNILAKFLELNQVLLPRSISDHYSIVIHVEVTNWGPKPFKFFNHWFDEDSYNQVVQNSWESIRNRQTDH